MNEYMKEFYKEEFEKGKAEECIKSAKDFIKA